MLSGRDPTLPSPAHAGKNFPTVFIEGGAILRIAKETTSSHFYVELKPESTVSVTFEVVKELQQANTIEIFCGLPEHEEKLVLNLAGQ